MDAKMASIFISIFDRFLNHFGSVLGSILVPTWLHAGVFLDVLAFCAALVAPNMRLGVSWGCLGCVLGHLGVSWVRLGASWRCLLDVSAQILERLVPGMLC